MTNINRVCIYSCVHKALDNRIYYREARSLQKAGYEVDLFAVHPHEELRGGIHIHPVPRWPRWKRPLLWLSLAYRVLQTKADIYHFHDPELLVISTWIRKIAKRPTIYDAHEAQADFIEIKEDIPAVVRIILLWLYRRLEPRLARQQSGLIFADDQIALSFKEIPVPKTTLFNYPDSDFIDKAIKLTQNPIDRSPTILYLGGLKRSRGSRLMLDAFSLVLQELPQAKLLLVGPFSPTSLEKEMHDDIRRLGLQNAVTLTGEVPFDQVSVYLTSAAIGWVPWLPVPKHQKNIPTKLFEYMAYAIPVVSSNLESVQPFIDHGGNGYLVTPDDPSAHARAIMEILSNPQKSLEMGRQGQNLVQNKYRWDDMEVRLLDFYNDVIKFVA